MRMNLIELASRTKLFNGLAADEVDDLLYLLNGMKKTCRKGEIVVLAGMPADHLLSVASGHLHAYAEASGEHPVLVREIAADEVLGLWVLHVPEVACWPSTIVAAEDSVLISLDMAKTRSLIKTSRPSVARMLANMSNLLASALFSMWRKMMVMNASTIEARVLTYLAELDSESGNTGKVVAPFDRSHMAEYFGVTRPSLSRALGNLRDRGLIAWRKNAFQLKTRR